MVVAVPGRVSRAGGQSARTVLQPAGYLKRLAATLLLGGTYGAAAWLSRRQKRKVRRDTPRTGRILVINTFHNPNWFRSHIRPLARCGIGEVILVCDDIVEPMDGVRFECPPTWLAALLSRAGAKFVWALRCAFRDRPDLCIGYHIFPCAVMALVVARLVDRPACYQDTSGPLELAGGGWNAENRLLRALQKPSPFVERKASEVVAEFDSVVVRGSGAASYIRGTGYDGPVAVITGSVQPHDVHRSYPERTIDLAFVGRLTEYKRPDRFIAVVAEVAKKRPDTRAVLIGTGPDADALQALARELGVAGNVEFAGQCSDVDDLLAGSRVFVLTSRWEGLSIAMLEAMAAGAVPVVADVGDLKDRIEDGVNGFVVAEDDIAGFADRVLRLLSDEEIWRRYSSMALTSAVAESGVDAIARKWNWHLRSIIARSRRPESLTCHIDPSDPT